MNLVASLGSPLSLGCIASLLCCTVDSTETSQAIAPESGPTLTEVRRLDGAELELVPIGDVVLAANGAIVFTQPIDNGVRIYPIQGEPQARGGEGRGPGQFTGIARLSWREDSLVVHDGAQGRLTLFSPGDYAAVRTIRYATRVTLEPDADGQVQVFPFVKPMALASGDTVVAELMAITSADVPAFQDQVVLASVGSDGRVRRILASTPNRGSVKLPSGGTMTLPFANLVHSAVSPAGNWIAVAATDRSEASPNGTLRVTLINARSGDTAHIAQRSLTFDLITKAYADSFLTHHAELLAEQSPEMAKVLEREGLPEYFPPLQWLLVTDEGRAYVELRDSGDERRYAVFERDGSLLGDLRIPDSGRIHAADGPRIVTIETDELDVPSLVEYEASWK